MHRSLLILAALAVVTPLDAQRGGNRRGGGDLWKYLADKYDKNQDGKITAAEYQRDVDKFKGYDSNGDGVITKEDAAGGGRRRGGTRPRGGRNQPTGNLTGPAIALALASNADTDGDRKVTAEEWKLTLATLDGNKDAVVDEDELNGIMCAALGRKQLSSRAIKRRARHIDANQDGKVQLGELGAMFATLDKNRDQVLSADELGAARPVVRMQPKVGDQAPDFTLPMVKDKKSLVRLSSFRGKQPVALIFGSYT